jgi:hypothetical protein
LPASAKILGGQACAWATDQRIMERRLYPRLLSVAETLWSGDHRGDYDSLTARLEEQMRRLHRLGVPNDEALPTEAIFTGPDLKTWATTSSLRFTLEQDVLRAPDASTGDVLKTKKSYRDFILSFDRRSDQNTGRTDFVIRCAEDQAGGAPRGFTVRSDAPPGMRIVAGDVAELKGWNHFELVARGRIVSLTINGYLAWSVTDPAPRAGPIALIGDEVGFEVKNITVRPLDLVAEAESSVAARD